MLLLCFNFSYNNFRFYFYATCILLLFHNGLKAQTNLVPNPSFEDTIACPNAASQIDRALGWINYGQTPDYFNSCSQNFSVPNNPRGHEPAHIGNAYAGLITYWPNDYREFIAINLIDSLIIGQRYYVSFYLSQQELAGDVIASNKIGIRFTTNSSYNAFNPFPTDNFSHIYSDSIVSNTNGWYKIASSFIADSAYNIIVIGNFFDNLNTDTISSNPNAIAAAYFLDDVCVSSDSINCFSDVFVYTISKTQVSISFNTNSKVLTILKESATNICFTLFDITGKLILHHNNITNALFNVTLDKLGVGIYFITISDGEKIFTKRIVII